METQLPAHATVTKNLCNESRVNTSSFHDAIISTPPSPSQQQVMNLITRCDNLLDNATVSSCLPVVFKQLSYFKEIVIQYQAYLTKQELEVNTSIAMTQPGTDLTQESMLRREICSQRSDQESSPLDPSNKYMHLLSWLVDKEQEIKTVDYYLQILKSQERPQINFVWSSSELDTILKEPKYEYVICLKLYIPCSSEPCFDKLKVSAQCPNSTPKYNDPVHSNTYIWYKDKTLMIHMRKHTRQFVSFARANKRDEISFVFTCCESNEENGSSIKLFRNGKEEDFYPPTMPYNIKSSKIIANTVCLEWSKPEYGSESVQSYTVCYGLEGETADLWDTVSTTGNETFLTIDNLQPECVYVFKVFAKCVAGRSEYSPLSDPITVISPLSHHFPDSFKNSSVLASSEGGLSIFKIQSEESYTIDGIHHVQIGKPSNSDMENKVLILVGATGAGKSTWINGMINYILGVEWIHNFRFKLVSDEQRSKACSQAKHITVYTIHPVGGLKIPYTLTIVDTPGFEDTSGLEQDLLITENFKRFFSNEFNTHVDHLNGIGFVIQSALMRLTPTQKYVFDSVLSVFGRDAIQNIFLMVTFSDSQNPPVMTAIEEANIPYNSVFKFNNSALYAQTTPVGTNNFDEMFWRMGANSFSKFFSTFLSMDNVTLTLTRQVLQERENAQTLSQSIQKLVRTCLMEIAQLKQARASLLSVESDVSINKNFTQEITVQYQRDSKEVAYMTKRRTIEELKVRYESALVKKSVLENEIENHQQWLDRSYAQLHVLVIDAKESILKLKEMALNSFPFAKANYIQLLIELEKKHAKEGWMDRVSSLETTKETAKILTILENFSFDNIDSQIERVKQAKSTGWGEAIETLKHIKAIVSAVHVCNAEH